MAWNLKVDNEIGILEFDCPDTEVNVLKSIYLAELRDQIEVVNQRSDIKCLLFTSAKKRIFIAGADINEIKDISSEKDAFEKAELGKEIFQKIEDLNIPTVTVINGACLGGGYELALSTTFRVAAASDKVKIGLPEVNLGILPGFGGSIRLPRLLGLVKSLPLILAGKICSADAALRNGMVDRLYPEVTLVERSVDFAREIITCGPRALKKKKKSNLMTSFLENTPPGRALVFQQARKNVMKKSKGFYPAPLQIIKLIAKTYGMKSPKAYKLESDHFAKLGATEISKNLITLFFMSERYKKYGWTDSKVKLGKVDKCGVIGAGVMGGGIAQLTSHRGIATRVKDLNLEALGGALREASKIYKGALKRRRIKPYQYDQKMGLISVGLENYGLKSCDFIIEAVVENLDIKKKVFAELDDVAGENAVLASNTSSLSVTQMAEATKRPERVAGLHFFNPVNRMPLVEVIRGKKTSDETLEKLIQFARKLGKTVIVVEDEIGFLVNRLLLPYLNEAAYLLEQGIPPETIDRIATEFGMPMGPIELVDQVGIDVGYKVAHILFERFGERMQVASILEKVYKDGLLGKKSGDGFYVYKGKDKSVNTKVPYPVPQVNAVTEEDALKRMIYVMINEAARCLDEKVIGEAGTVDIGMIFGTGFPPFRAGLLHYADKVGADNIVLDLKRFQKTVDEKRFEPCAYLAKLAESKQSFYG